MYLKILLLLDLQLIVALQDCGCFKTKSPQSNINANTKD